MIGSNPFSNCRFWLLLFVLFGSASTTVSSEITLDYLEVRRTTSIRGEPVAGGIEIAQVEKGEFLILLDNGDQMGGFYHVRTRSNADGWIYRSMVRRYRGEMPSPNITGDDAFDDPTYALPQTLQEAAAAHLRHGKPQGTYERVRAGYAYAVDPRLRIPIWVQYELKASDLGRETQRSNDFRQDTSLPDIARAALEDYAGSGFDRGHMAPAGDMVRDNNVMSESFYLSNMAPQVGIGFNRHIWRDFESSVRSWTELIGTVTIITGPVFMASNGMVEYEVIGDRNVAVPTHFFKIVVDFSDPTQPQSVAILMPNESLTGHTYLEFVTTIDVIEDLTGLDFFNRIPLPVQEQFESIANPSL